ncbi:MAG: hypothetical protein M1607_00475 [Patescibacteria group bacterium]|nr:hypothetical protein [Patescibacteria group bacterium]
MGFRKEVRILESLIDKQITPVSLLGQAGRSEPKCLVEQTGSCTGCNILEIFLAKRAALPRSGESALATKVRTSLCPDGIQMQVPRRVEQNIW